MLIIDDEPTEKGQIVFAHDGEAHFLIDWQEPSRLNPEGKVYIRPICLSVVFEFKPDVIGAKFCGPPLIKHYFTFGCGQKYSPGYTVIEAEDENQAREIMNQRFGNKWSMIYDHLEEIHALDRKNEVIWHQPTIMKH